MSSQDALNKALHEAVREDDMPAVKALLRKGADVNSFDGSGYTVLAFIDNVEILKDLLEAGADPNAAREGEGPDAMYWACFSNRVEVARLLIQAGVRFESELSDRGDGWDWESSLHAAVEKNNLALTKMLLDAGAGCLLDTFDYVCRSPLIIAVEQGNLEIAQLLIDAGADVDARDEERIGDPAIRRAASEQGLEMVKLLLDAGANPLVEGWMRCTAFDDANRRADGLGSQMLRMLKDSVDARSGDGAV